MQTTPTTSDPLSEPPLPASLNSSKSWIKFDDNGETVVDNLPETVPEEISPQQCATLEISQQIKSDSNSDKLPPPGSNGVKSSTNFANGDVIVTLMPLNESCDWITPAKFKAHLVPEELMAQQLTLTVEDYVTTMSILFNDYRFNLYITLRRRILPIWIGIGILLLLGILFSGWKGVGLFVATIIWLISNAVGIFVCIFLKKRLYRLLEQSVAQVNSVFSKHCLFLGVDDWGNLSCHKISLTFVYFDSKYCVKFLQDLLANSEQLVINHRLNNSQANNQAVNTLNNTLASIDTDDIIITGSEGRRNISQKEKYAEKLIYRYSQRWIRQYSREQAEQKQDPPAAAAATGEEAAGVSVTVEPPRHCRQSKCFCQFIEQHLKSKPTSGWLCNLTELFAW